MAEKGCSKDKIEVGFYHLDPRWCSFDDFKFMMSRNIVNSIKVECGYGTSADAIEIAREYGHNAWLGVEKYNVRGKSKETIPEYMAKIRAYVDTLKERDLWDTVVGFHWDEPILGMTNEDFLETSKAISEEFGKRIFPVFSGQEVMGQKGNWNDPDGMLILEEFATEYLTDIGFDAYGYDYRVPSTETMQNRFKVINEKFPEIYSTETYYRHYFDTLKKRCLNKKARVWVFPCTYRTGTWAGIPSDEDYCVAHLKGLTNLLLEQEYPGGIMGYTYKSWSDASIGLDLFLDKNNPDRWIKFEEAMRETYEKVKDIEIK